jgi:hypothetical protein
MLSSGALYQLVVILLQTATPFAGFRWPREIITLTVHWYCSYRLSAANVVALLAERGIDVSARTVLTWVQTFGPLLAEVARRRDEDGRVVGDEGPRPRRCQDTRSHSAAAGSARSGPDRRRDQCPAVSLATGDWHGRAGRPARPINWHRHNRTPLTGVRVRCTLWIE